MFAKLLGYLTICVLLQKSVAAQNAGETRAQISEILPGILAALARPRGSLPVADPVPSVSTPAVEIPTASDLTQSGSNLGGLGGEALMNMLSGFAKDPVKSLMGIVEEMGGKIAQNLPGGDPSARDGMPLNFLNIFETLQNTIDHIGGQREECAPVLKVMDHSIYSFKEVLSVMNAFQKMNGLWANISRETLSSCLRQPGALDDIAQGGL